MWLLIFVLVAVLALLWIKFGLRKQSEAMNVMDSFAKELAEVSQALSPKEIRRNEMIALQKQKNEQTARLMTEFQNAVNDMGEGTSWDKVLDKHATNDSPLPANWIEKLRRLDQLQSEILRVGGKNSPLKLYGTIERAHRTFNAVRDAAQKHVSEGNPVTDKAELSQLLGKWDGITNATNIRVEKLRELAK